MQVSVKEVFNDLESKRELCYQTLMNLLPEYIYREKRYHIHFSVTLIYSQDNLATCERGLRPLLRKTDKLLCITPHLLCATFDATNTSSYVKAAENLHETLKKLTINTDTSSQQSAHKSLMKIILICSTDSMKDSSTL